MRGYPQFSFWISITLVQVCFSRIFSKRRENTFELVGTVLKDQDSANFVRIQAPNSKLQSNPYLSVEKLAKTSKNASPNHSWLINSALCTNFNVTCTIQVAMLATHVAI